MRKAIIAIVISTILLVEIVVGAFIVIDVQVLKFPKTTIAVDLLEITPDEALLHHSIKIDNPNSFDLSVTDVEIIVTTDKGEQVAHIDEGGGIISSQGNRTFSADDHIAFTNDTSGVLISTVTGTIGVNIFGLFKKTVPLDITVITSFKEPLEQISLPTLHASVEFGAITRDDIELNTTIDASNPNSFDMTLSDVIMTIDTDAGKRVGDFQISSGTLTAKEATTLTGHGLILLEALNGKKLFAKITAEVGATIAGISKTFPFSSEIDITLPSIQELLTGDKPLELAIAIDFKLAKGGLLGDVSLVVDNPTKMPLYARDIVVQYYAVRGETKTFLGDSRLGEGELVPENVTVFKGEILLPLAALLKPSKGSLLPDSLFARLSVNISIAGLNQTLWVALGSYTDIHILRLNK